MYDIIYSSRAVADMVKLAKSGNVKLSKKLRSFLLEIEQTPRTGTGQVEQLKYCEVETCSRRLSKEHRLVYEIDDNTITILIVSVLFHYSEK